VLPSYTTASIVILYLPKPRIRASPPERGKPGHESLGFFLFISLLFMHTNVLFLQYYVAYFISKHP
jgi:hypothetical protein